MRHVDITISGLVQGVFFRRNIQAKARELNINGWIKNELDGRVYFDAEGKEENLNKLINWCRQSPGASRVKGMDCFFSSKLKGFDDFEIRF